MTFTVRTSDPQTARTEAKARVPKGRDVHISAVYFVKEDPTVRDFVFSTVLNG